MRIPGLSRQTTCLTRDQAKVIFSVLLLLISISSFSQLQVSGGGGGGSFNNNGMPSIRRDFNGDIGDSRMMEGKVGTPSFMALSASGGLKLPDLSMIDGSPFLHPNYNTAFVRLKSGVTAKVPVKYNLYGNEIIFVQNKNELALDSVDYVYYTAPNADNKVEEVHLKSGYPAIGNLTSNNIYQILDSGSNVHLLKYSYATIEEIKTMGVAPKKQFTIKTEYYVLTPNGVMKKIKMDKNSITDALPEFAGRFEATINERKLKLKKESDLIELFRASIPELKAF